MGTSKHMLITTLTLVDSQLVIGGKDTTFDIWSKRNGYSVFPFSRSKYLENNHYF